MIFAVKLEKYMASTSILGIIVSKLYYRKKLCLTILFEIDEDSKASFYYAILPLNLAICLRIEGD